MQEWRVVIWTTANNGNSFYVGTKAEAYVLTNEHTDAYAIEIYGPDGFYDGVE